MTKEKKFEGGSFNKNDLVFFFTSNDEKHGGEVIGTNGTDVWIRQARGGKITVSESLVQKAEFSGIYLVHSKGKTKFGARTKIGFFFGVLPQDGETRVFELPGGGFKLCRGRVPRVQKKEKKRGIALVDPYDESPQTD